MEVVLSVIGAIAVVLGLISAFEVYQTLPSITLSINSVVALASLTGPASLVVTGILILAFASVVHFLRDIRNATRRTAEYLREVARSDQ